MRPTITAFAILAVLPLAGCTGERAGTADAEYRLSGTFTENATQEEIQQLSQYVEARDGDLAILESFPLQFATSGLSGDACEEVQAFAQGQAYVARVGECQRVEPTTNPDAPVSGG